MKTKTKFNIITRLLHSSEQSLLFGFAQSGIFKSALAFIGSLAYCLISTLALAQAPHKISYQAVIRNASNALITNQNIGMRISILQGTSTGTSVYTETQTSITNANGLSSLQIGNGTVVSGNFTNINWANGPYFIKTETDPLGGLNYTITSTQQFLSVPYALYAATSGSTSTNGKLDQAYDAGAYKGAGRNIIADSGAVKIEGEDGLLVTGTFGEGDTAENVGGGVRMFFNPRKAAFRAGRVIYSNWNHDSIGPYSIGLGYNVKAVGNNAIAIGSGNVASGQTSVAMGSATEATGDYSTAMGRETKATGNYATAMGYLNYANGDYSTAFGYASFANGFNSTAMGFLTSANGAKSTAMGVSTQAVGDYSTAMGYATIADGENSTAIGRFLQANGYSSLVVGIYNDPIVTTQAAMTSTTPLFIIGNGNSNSVSNALVVRNDGHVGIGTNTPANKLDVDGGIAIGASYSGLSTAPNNGAIIQGNVGIGTAIPLSKLDVKGGVSIGTSYAGNISAPINGAIIQGRVGVGLNNPSTVLHVDGSSDASLLSHGNFISGDITNTNIVMDANEIIARDNGANSPLFIQSTGGFLGVGSGTVPTHVLHINGIGRSTSSTWATASDKRVKKNIESLPSSSLNKILKLRPVTYQWIDEYKNANKNLKESNTGFISQELEEVFPEMIEKVNEQFGDRSIADFRILNLSDLPIHLVKAMQEQEEKVSSLQLALSSQQLTIDGQEKQIEELKKQVTQLAQLIKK